MLMISGGRYRNRDAIKNNIRYITRTRENENRRAELIYYGFYGAYHIPEIAIEQFEIVQRRLRNPGGIGKKLFHETLLLDEKDLALLNGNQNHIIEYAKMCAYFYFSSGFQVAYAVHWDQEKKYHIHFVGNSVNFSNGHKWHNNYDKEKIREENFKYYLCKYNQMYVNVSNHYIQPVSFGYQMVSMNNTVSCRRQKTFYAVANGNVCGIFEDIIDSHSSVENYKNSLYKKCLSLSEAYDYFLQYLDWRDHYVIRIWGFSCAFEEYHAFMSFLNTFQTVYYYMGI